MRLFVLLVIFAIPFHSFASVFINEVMYDLEGTDSDREWIEVKNDSSESINFSEWKFYENSSNHGVTLYQGEEVISPGGFAVIVDSPETFLSDWPSFSGNLFDSSWSSFSNAGETFSIKNEDGDVIDEITYTSEDGAGGDGNSLQIIGGVLVPASPTPGAENQPGEVVNTENVSVQDTEDTGEDDIGSLDNTFGIPDRVISGEKIKFAPELHDNEGELLFKSLFVWNLGDGNTREDDYRRDFYHTYEYPGSYVVYVEVYENGRRKDEPDHVFRQTIKVSSANVLMTVGDGFVSIKNKSIYELDLGGWGIVLPESYFNIPDNTIVLPGKEIYFSNDVLGVDELRYVSLQNEMGTIISSVNTPEEEPEEVKTKTIYVPAPNPQPVVEKIVDRSAEENIQVEFDSQLASAKNSLSEKEKGFPWVLVYVALILSVIGAVAYMYFRDEEDFINEINNEADEYTFEN
jgi:hypothetical protein